MPNSKPCKGEPLVFFDIETLPCLPDDPLWLDLKTNEADRKKTALLAPLGRVWMVGWAVGGGDPQISGGDGSPQAEKEVLERFWEEVKDIDNPWWVGYNVQGFDIPFLQVRALVHGMPALASKLSRVTTKPWDRRVLDLAQIWPRTGADKNAWRDGIRGVGKLDTICQVLGIPQQTGVMGPGVADAWELGDHAGVEEHLRLDVLQVRDLFKRLWPLL